MPIAEPLNALSAGCGIIDADDMIRIQTYQVFHKVAREQSER